jgi:RimJ/RimL family protein N-acetyltransferase
MPNLNPDLIPRGTLAGSAQPALAAGSSFRLRPWSLADVPAVVTAYTDPDIQRWHLQTMDEAEAARWIEQQAAGWADETDAGWAITDAASGVVLGRIGLRQVHLGEGRAEFAYWVLPAARGRGAATSAVQRITRWAFDEIGLHRLELVHALHNQPSCAVAAKAAFPLEGVMRDFALHPDGWHDYHLHARIGPTTPHS